MNELELITLFCQVDDFYKRFEVKCAEENSALRRQRQRIRYFRTSHSEVMTILLLFHTSGYRTFKWFYLNKIHREWKKYFPNLVSYSRFVQLISEVVFPLFCFVHEHQGQCEGILLLDSTLLTSCHLKRASSHRTFKSWACKGKTTTGWFFGFRLHLAINHKSEIGAFRLTWGNIDDRKPVSTMLKGMQGKVYADRGYISKKLSETLLHSGLQLFTRIKKNMKNKLLSFTDKIMLKKRALIESVHNVLKNSCQIEHHRHRSRWNFMSNLLAGLAAYCLDPGKPRLFSSQEIKKLKLCSS